MEKLTMTKKEFKKIMEVLPKAAQDDVRPILQGVYFGKGEVVAIDGYRLSKRFLNAELIGEYVILGDDLKKVLKACKRDIEYIEILLDNKVVVNLYDQEEVLVDAFECRLLDGRYISYKSLLPREFTDVVEISSKDILELIKPLKVYTHIALEFINDEINIYEVQYGNKRKDEVATLSKLGTIYLKKKVGVDLLIGLNPTYLKEALKGFKDIKLSYIDKVSPLVIEDSDRCEMILPIRFIGELRKVS